VGAVVTPQRTTGGDSASRHSRLLTHREPPTSTAANKYLPRTTPASPRNNKWRPSSLALRQLHHTVRVYECGAEDKSRDERSFSRTHHLRSLGAGLI
ncbi:unnamed protein product, partial [Ectocarpus sp. 12 AP-2014]